MAQDTALDRKQATNAIPCRRKLTLADVRDIAAKVVSSRLNESQACYSLNINPKQWFNFKQKHSKQEQFNAIIETIRASQIENCVQVINNHGDGVEYTVLNKQGEVVTLTKPGDWRAKAWIAERVLSPEVFGQQQAAIAAGQLDPYAQLGLDVAKLLGQAYAQAGSKAVVDVAEVKQIEPPKQ